MASARPQAKRLKLNQALDYVLDSNSDDSSSCSESDSEYAHTSESENSELEENFTHDFDRNRLTPTGSSTKKIVNTWENDVVLDENEWTCVTNEDCPWYPQTQPFLGHPGTTLPVMLRREPVDFLNLIWTDDVLDRIAANTDNITRSKIDEKKENLSTHSRLRKWSTPNKNDIRKLMGIVINMGIIRLPRLTDYWSTNFAINTPFFSDVMSRDKFLLLFWNLHVAEPIPVNHPVLEKDYKIKWLIDYTNNRFKNLYEPDQDIAVDETMVKFKGRISFRQYNPKKTLKWGMKLFTLAESKSGYMWHEKLYVGADGRADDDQLSKCAQHVHDLVHPLSDLGYTIYADRYFWTLALAEKLSDLGFNFTGTLMPNRKGFPQQLKSGKRLKCGDVMAFRKDDILVLQWKDKRVVTMISSAHSSDQWSTVKSKRPGKPDRRKPTCITDYNKNMNGVDVCDQLCTYYCFDRSSMKWWRKIFFHLVEVSMVNSYILYKSDKLERGETDRVLSAKEFRLSIVNSLCHVTGTSKPTCTRQNELERMDGKQHFSSKGDSPKECKVCSNRKLGKEYRNETIYVCGTCSDEPSLHPECMRRYHTVINYSQPKQKSVSKMKRFSGGS